MSDTARLRAQVQILEARRAAHLENAAFYRAQADKARYLRDKPGDPTRTYEYQRQMDAEAARLDADADADRSTREAESTLVEQRGIEQRAEMAQPVEGSLMVWRTLSTTSGLMARGATATSRSMNGAVQNAAFGVARPRRARRAPAARRPGSRAGERRLLRLPRRGPPPGRGAAAPRRAPPRRRRRPAHREAPPDRPARRRPRAGTRPWSARPAPGRPACCSSRGRSRAWPPGTRS